MLISKTTINGKTRVVLKIDKDEKARVELAEVNNRIFYYGTNVIVKNPTSLKHNSVKDLGAGFYLTTSENRAKDFAICKKKTNKTAIVNMYKLISTKDIRVKVFKQPNAEWLNFISNCRLGILSAYDIVKSPIINDTIARTIGLYLRGDLTQYEYLKVCNLSPLEYQYCFYTEKSMKCLEFLKSYKVI